MLHETVKEWPKQWLAQGREEGRQEGRLEGRQIGLREGERNLLARQIEHKFGPLDDIARERLDRADLDTLRAWGERLLDAESLDEVWDA